MLKNDKNDIGDGVDEQFFEKFKDLNYTQEQIKMNSNKWNWFLATPPPCSREEQWLSFGTDSLMERNKQKHRL